MDRSFVRAGAQISRALLVLTAVFSILLAGASSAAAQTDTIDRWATSIPDALSYDLTSMVLPPEAYPVYGLVSLDAGEMRSPQTEAAAFAKVLGFTRGELLEEMQASGWQARYVSEVALPSQGDVSSFLIGGWSSVTEHATPEGAQAGFALLDDSAVLGTELVDARTIGEASRLTHAKGVDNTGRLYERLRYTFVSGDLVGSVAIFWYDGAPSGPVDPETMVQTAEMLLVRMQSGAMS